MGIAEVLPKVSVKDLGKRLMPRFSEQTVDRIDFATTKIIGPALIGFGAFSAAVDFLQTPLLFNLLFGSAWAIIIKGGINGLSIHVFDTKKPAEPDTK